MVLMMTFHGPRTALITRVNSINSQSDVKIEGTRGWALTEVEDRVREELSGLDFRGVVAVED